jgi:hypothetical protein
MYLYENMLPPSFINSYFLDYVDPDNIDWKRPSEICHPQTACFEDDEGLEADDVI